MSTWPGFAFLGERQYLHSTTLFRFFQEVGVAGRHTPRDVDFVFIRRTDRICRIEHLANPVTPEDAVAVYSDQSLRLAAIPMPETLRERWPYSEERVCNFSVLKGSRLEVGTDPEGRMGFLECVVAGFKLLLQERASGQPLLHSFVRLRATVIPEGAMAIEYIRSLPGGFQEGAVLEQGKRIGAIYFKEEVR